MESGAPFSNSWSPQALFIVARSPGSPLLRGRSPELEPQTPLGACKLKNVPFDQSVDKFLHLPGLLPLHFQHRSWFLLSKSAKQDHWSHLKPLTVKTYQKIQPRNISPTHMKVEFKSVHQIGIWWKCLMK